MPAEITNIHQLLRRADALDGEAFTLRAAGDSASAAQANIAARDYRDQAEQILRRAA